ncbi:hypothetical protein C0J52_01829 [Blattella germanica]|nr:hypothetical protein C0J52_01829 [Blattella germanica]
MVAELTSIAVAVASNNSHKSASSAGGRLSQLPQWIQTATRNNSHKYTSSADQPMYTSVTKATKSSPLRNANEPSSKTDDVGYWRPSNVAGASTTDPVGLLNRQSPGRGIVGLVGPYRVSSDRLDAMGSHEDVDEDDAGERPGRLGSDSAGVSSAGGGERRVFVLRDEELVEESDFRRSQEDAAKSKNRSSEDEDGVVAVSPTPGRENWRLRESKKLTGDRSGGEDRRGMCMTDIWPKDWGSKCLVLLFSAPLSN